MRWVVVVTPPSGVSEAGVEVQAATWESALREVVGAPSGGFAGWSVELTPSGWKIVDPRSKTRYFLSSEASETQRASAPAPAAGRHTQPGGTVPLTPAPHQGMSIPSPARVPAEARALVESPPPRRPLRVPRVSEITMRRAGPTRDTPYAYVESGLLVPLGTNEEEAEAALREVYEHTVRGFAPGEAFRVMLGAFDEYFVGTPHTRALAVLDARSWQLPPRITFPARAAANAVPIGGSLPPPPRANPEVGPFAIPQVAAAAPAAEADLFLGPARTPTAAPPPVAPADMPTRVVENVEQVQRKSQASMPPPLPAILPSARPTVADEMAAVSAPRPHLPLWDATQIRAFPASRSSIELADAWLDSAFESLLPSRAYVLFFDLQQSEFVVVAARGTGAAFHLATRIKSGDTMLASALRTSGLVDIPAGRIRGLARYEGANTASTLAVALTGAGRVLGVVELSLPAPLAVERRRELDASVRALSSFLDRRGVHLDEAAMRTLNTGAKARV